MLNDKETYERSGQICARATRRGDAGLAKFERNWFNEALYLEKKEDRPIIRQWFDEAYKEESGFNDMCNRAWKLT
jgi:hypothetical protein